MVAHCLGAFPEEGCGLLAGDPPTAAVRRCFPTRNAAGVGAALRRRSPRPPARRPGRRGGGLLIIGVFHSHTHTDAYPSPTDVAQAPDPSWHYVLVSLRHEVPSLRSYRIVDGDDRRGAASSRRRPVRPTHECGAAR